MSLARITVITALLLLLGAAGGEAAALIGTPMPWMLGSLTLCAVVILAAQPASLKGYAFPQGFRTGFIAVIGVMIGAQVTPELLGLAAQLPWTIAGLVLFIGIAHGGNHLIFRRLGGYDRPTAFYSGTPGGLMESVLLGEGNGADTRILVAQQYLRVVLVITLLPLGLSLWMGTPVGSAAGLRMAGGAGTADAMSLLVLVAVAAVGLALARLIHLPAAQLTGPMIVAAGVTLSGVVPLHLPVWLIAAAQIVIGVSLSVRFHGMDVRLLQRCVALAVCSVGFMLALGAGFAVALNRITGIETLHLMISFAPGGVAEMSVVALSLAANPALVGVHHILRILLTVGELTLASRLFGFRTADAPDSKSG